MYSTLGRAYTWAYIPRGSPVSHKPPRTHQHTPLHSPPVPCSTPLARRRRCVTTYSGSHVRSLLLPPTPPAVPTSTAVRRAAVTRSTTPSAASTLVAFAASRRRTHCRHSRRTSSHRGSSISYTHWPGLSQHFSHTHCVTQSDNMSPSSASAVRPVRELPNGGCPRPHRLICAPRSPHALCATASLIKR